ncbi:MAG: HAD-IB family hydrolase [Treponema sp.]|jgi:HAD superfamily hydrolase (TIGR01490 family)|nr:HAD-IB family hydrolase [Treponema sp.]
MAIHVFDVDYTIIKKPSSWYFLLEALGKKAIGIGNIIRLPFEWLRYKAGLPNQDFIEEAVKRLAGIEKSALEQLAAACFERRVRRNIYREAAELVEKIRNRGEEVFFATSSISIIIEPLEKFFGAGESIASVLEFSEGKTTGRLRGAGCFGGKKKAAVEARLARHSIKPENVYFYSDSCTDLPLLEFCGHPVAVNPDRFLAREAKKHGWEILRFRETLGDAPGTG